jgi:hypothetical protein
MEQYILITTEEGATNQRWRLKMVFPSLLQEFTTFFGPLFCIGFVLEVRIFRRNKVFEKKNRKNSTS